ncbi:DUF861 domain-containing protein [Arthrobacter sp. ISL-95]|nr:DUF861 domain-containing protein [Arthrobacter sp. ISL-95]
MHVNANTHALDHQPVEPWQQIDPAATTGSRVLDVCFGAELGLWEMSAGRMKDIEADEVFVVLSGSGTLEFVSPSLPSIELQTGSVVRLTEGMRTRWTMRDSPLRKLYILSAKEDGDDSD